VSCANIPRRQDEREEAVDLIRWYVVYAIESGATSWSMEQVSTPIVVKTLEALKAPGSPYRNKFEYGTFEFSDYGVPQQRKRLLAGSPGVVAKFRRIDKWHRSTKDAIAEPRGTHVRNNVCLGYRIHNPFNPSVKRYKRYTIEDSTRPISMPAYTVVSGNSLNWATFEDGPSGEEYRNSYDYTSLESFTVKESAKLQCFPDDYVFAEGKQNGMRLVGNAIPPVIMKQLLPTFMLPRFGQ
jgi:site-specific DNA-cytosine methylase